MWLGEILGGYGNSLSLSGRFEEADRNLTEAMSVGRELQNPAIIVQTLKFQADRLFYGGDTKAAVERTTEAVQLAGRGADRALVLQAQAAAASLAVATQPTKTLASRLATLSQEADSIGLPALSVECLLARVDALIKLRDYATARDEANRALARAETLTLRTLITRARYLRGNALRLSNESDATRDYAFVVRLLDEIKAEDGNQNILKRVDVGAMYAESLAYSKPK